MGFCVTDHEGRLVRLKDDTLQHHILVRHTNVSEDAIRRTIERPETVFASARQATDEIYLLRRADPSSYTLYCKVVVDFSNPQMGTVRTAMYTDRIGGVSTVRYMQVDNRPR
jgi:hypothetical protein